MAVWPTLVDATAPDVCNCLTMIGQSIIGESIVPRCSATSLTPARPAVSSRSSRAGQPSSCSVSAGSLPISCIPAPAHQEATGNYLKLAGFQKIVG